MFYSIAILKAGRYYLLGKYTTLSECTDTLTGFAKNFVNQDLVGIGCATQDMLIQLGIRLT